MNANIVTPHELNHPDVRRAVEHAEVVWSVDPTDGTQTVQAGLNLLRWIADGSTTVAIPVAYISAEQNSPELEWVIAALVALRGAARVDDTTFVQAVQPLADIMRATWAAGDHVPTPDELPPHEDQENDDNDQDGSKNGPR